MANLYKGKHVIVLGLARSGFAVAKLLHQLGAKVTVNDAKPRSECKEADQLEEMGVTVICGGHPDSLIDSSVDLLVKNPGIPYQVKPIVQALEKQIPVVTEVEIASQLCQAMIIGITGSNGKTTTTTLVGKMLEASGVKTTVAGNIGQALSDVVLTLEEDERLVAELSSFQLKGTKEFCPQIGALLNVTSAHMDYHHTMEDYLDSKLHMFQNQTEHEVAVLNADSPICQQVVQSGKIPSRIVWFSREQIVEHGVYVKDGWIVAHLTDEILPILPVKEVALPGSFNLENALAASAITLCAGGNINGIANTLRTFQGVEHRLEYVETIQGVRYYNDSKATNAQAASKALTSFQEPIIWIAGGLDRGVSFQELVPIMEKHVKAVVTYGQSAPILSERAQEAGIKQVVQAHEIKEAVQLANSLASKGEVVLLSPACASWDLYTSFEQRGSIFKQAVHSLLIRD